MVKAYPKYKNSYIPWIGEVPEHWDVLALARLLKERKEKNSPVKTDNILSLSMTRGVILYADKDPGGNKSKEDLSAYMLAYPGDIVLNSMNVVVGSVGLSKYFGAVSPVYYMLRPRNGKDSVEYFDAIFRNVVFQRSLFGLGNGIMYIESKTSGKLNTIRLRIPMSRLKRVSLPYPTSEEQVAIARFVSCMDKCIRRYINVKQQVIKLLNAQKQAIINKAITHGIDQNVKLKPSGVEFLGDIASHWTVSKIKQTSRLIVSNVDKHTFPDELPVRLCNYVDVYKNERIRSNMNFMQATATADEASRFKLQKGDVVITKDSEEWTDIAVPALVEYEADDFICGYHLAILRSDPKKIESEFLFRVLQSSIVASQFHVSANGVTRYGLSHQSIKDVLIPLPPLEEQKKIVAYIAKEILDFQKIIDGAIAEIDLIKEYRSRLHSDAVTGKIDVRGIKLPDLGEEALQEPIDEHEISDDIEDSEEVVNADE